MLIRREKSGDEKAIYALTRAAFATARHSNGTETDIVDALRDAGSLRLSLVAEDAGEIVGHVAFSPVTIAGRDEGWLGLGPISVAPDRQGSGIGSALVREGLDHIRKAGAGGCVLVGDPAYYSRFGFKGGTALTYQGVEVQYVQQLAFNDEMRAGNLRYCDAFEKAAAGQN